MTQDAWKDVIDRLQPDSVLKPLFEQRRELGIQQYGVHLSSTSVDNYQALVEEMLDGIAYAEALKHNKVAMSEEQRTTLVRLGAMLALQIFRAL